MGIRLIPGFLLHWNIWFILPISGLLFGALAAYRIRRRNCPLCGIILLHRLDE